MKRLSKKAVDARRHREFQRMCRRVHRGNLAAQQVADNVFGLIGMGADFDDERVVPVSLGDLKVGLVSAYQRGYQDGVKYKK